MPRCPFCDKRNPAEAVRCAGCGADLRGSPGFAERESESRGDAAPPERGKPAQPASEPAVETPQSDLEREVLTLLRRREKIAAVKLWRQRTGSGLKEAVDAVNALAARHGVTGLQTGCSTVLALLAAALLLLGVTAARSAPAPGAGCQASERGMRSATPGGSTSGPTPRAGCGRWG